MFQAQCKIISNSRLDGRYFLMDIKAPSIARAAMPGQFVTIRCDGAAAVFLRRPFSFHRIKAPSFEILYEVIGEGTRLLANKRSGERIDVLGPLGNGFAIPKRRSKFILVAGGIGVAPLIALAEALVSTTRKGNEIHAIIGAKNRKAIRCENDFKRLGIKPIIATDNGSYGTKALASEVLDEVLKGMGALLPMIFTCGPEPMLKEVAHIVRKRGLKCYASLEENIACGVGACLGCAVKTKSGYKLVCKDGPVFELNEIIW